jgi:hypothetical protein
MGARFSTADVHFELHLPAWALCALNDVSTRMPADETRTATSIEPAAMSARIPRVQSRPGASRGTPSIG